MSVYDSVIVVKTCYSVVINERMMCVGKGRAGYECNEKGKGETEMQKLSHLH